MKKIKNNIRRAILGLILVSSTLIVSCEDWLSVKPSNQTEASVIFSTERGFQEVLSGVYTNMTKPASYGREMTFGTVDILGQQWAGVNTSYTLYYQLQRYNYEDAKAIGLIDNIWSSQFNSIAQLNNILDYIDVNKSVFALEENYSMIKGETLALRAFLHFDLLRLYAPYTTAENKSEKWLPYADQFTRNTSESLTNDQFVDKLNADLVAALELLKKDDIYTGKVNVDTYYLNRNFHINYYAVRALQARVALYLGDSQTALTAATEVINAQKTKKLFRFVTVEEATISVKAHRDRTFSSEHLFALNVRKLQDYTEGYFYKVSPAYVFKPRVAPATLYEGISEYRKEFFETESTIVDISSKFWQLDAVSGTAIPQKKQRMPLIRISEMYYIAAETAGNIQTATDYLNEVRTNRGISDKLSNLDEATLKAEILKEYNKEFVGEGQVFYYHKRKNSPKISTQSIVPKYVLPIPELEIDFGGRNDYYKNN